MNFIFLLIGIATGGTMVWLFLKNKSAETAGILQNKINELDRERSVFQDRLSHQVELYDSVQSQLESERRSNLTLHTQLAELRTLNQNFQEKLTDQKRDIEELQTRFNKEFENLANRILEEKSLKFTEQNRNNLDIILNPLKERIKEFEQKVDTAYKAESVERNTLKGEIKSLVELNKQISEEANNLARALKGDSKQQGSWGELILEKILERSGLVKGEEYRIQVSTNTDDGKRFQPDVVVFLPDEKHIIIDAKVSLVAYDGMIKASDDVEREARLRDHLISVRNHIKNLSEKNYQQSADFTSPDFVLLFMPIESSFGTALQADQDLFSYAWDRKIVIVSPSTLLATLRTIASIWKQERQTKNALEIARQSGALYDKFKNFLDDLMEVGKKMDAAKTSYADAMNKLSSGSGNIVRRIEELRKLGAKTSKELPPAIIERAQENIES